MTLDEALQNRTEKQTTLIQAKQEFNAKQSAQRSAKSKAQSAARSVQSRQSAVESAQSALDSAQSDFERAAAQILLDRANSALQSAQDQLESANNDLDNAEGEFSAAKVDLDFAQRAFDEANRTINNGDYRKNSETPVPSNLLPTSIAPALANPPVGTARVGRVVFAPTYVEGDNSGFGNTSGAGWTGTRGNGEYVLQATGGVGTNGVVVNVGLERVAVHCRVTLAPQSAGGQPLVFSIGLRRPKNSEPRRPYFNVTFAATQSNTTVSLGTSSSAVIASSSSSAWASGRTLDVSVHSYSKKLKLWIDGAPVFDVEQSGLEGKGSIEFLVGGAGSVSLSDMSITALD
jgi:hypothetical protein